MRSRAAPTTQALTPLPHVMAMGLLRSRFALAMTWRISSGVFRKPLDVTTSDHGTCEHADSYAFND
eukprot:CAMPEP_0196732542 /NCGR_PEP_ID=MMETSP1091-20130531/11920_1 /TAXON_ID=302021 /ORGANISM="Rhodomonas sp., Strain CCMP768" /LENGTH=65 /DNA_ID=CAMNT_0042075827 /DNA_START=233 /DNA_END=427 /DNA_ORIENTATION=+